MVRLATEMIDLGHYEMGATLIEKARQSLSATDRSLGDAQSILGGYTKAKKEPETLGTPESVSTSEPANVD